MPDPEEREVEITVDGESGEVEEVKIYDIETEESE